jgi:hypothetical protein
MCLEQGVKEQPSSNCQYVNLLHHLFSFSVLEAHPPLVCGPDTHRYYLN